MSFCGVPLCVCACKCLCVCICAGASGWGWRWGWWRLCCRCSIVSYREPRPCSEAAGELQGLLSLTGLLRCGCATVSQAVESWKWLFTGFLLKPPFCRMQKAWRQTQPIYALLGSVRLYFRNTSSELYHVLLSDVLQRFASRVFGLIITDDAL